MPVEELRSTERECGAHRRSPSNVDASTFRCVPWTSVHDSRLSG